MLNAEIGNVAREVKMMDMSDVATWTWTSATQFAASEAVTEQPTSSSDEWAPGAELQEDEADEFGGTVNLRALTAWIDETEQPEVNEQRERQQQTTGRQYSKNELMQEAYQLILDLNAGRAKDDSLDVLAAIASQTHGGEALANAMEAVITSSKQGARPLMSLFGRARNSEAAANALARVQAEMATALPRRAAGLLLLVTDEEGGYEAVTALFDGAAASTTASIRMGTLLEKTTGDPNGLQGMTELLDTMTRQREDGGKDGSDAMARCIGEASRWIEGAEKILPMLRNLLEAEGGARLVSTLLQRWTATRDGRQAIGTMLRCLSRQDAETTAQVLARASASANGAADVASAFERISSTQRGRRAVNLALTRIDRTAAGARFLETLSNAGFEVEGESQSRRTVTVEQYSGWSWLTRLVA